MTLFEIFRTQARPLNKSNPWYYVGRRSSFLDIQQSLSGGLSEANPCQSDDSSGGIPNFDSLSAFKIVQTDSATPSILSASEAVEQEGLDDQVLVFQYRGKFHAVDHQCPHSSFPLSRGRVGDIEDFGVVLSAEITCPKHGWAFDLFTGQSDRGLYQLGIWDVELRKGTDETESGEVWVRKKVRQRQG